MSCNLALNSSSSASGNACSKPAGAQRQYLYFCTSKASELSTSVARAQQTRNGLVVEPRNHLGKKYTKLTLLLNERAQERERGRGESESESERDRLTERASEKIKMTTLLLSQPRKKCLFLMACGLLLDTYTPT